MHDVPSFPKGGVDLLLRTADAQQGGLQPSDTLVELPRQHTFAADLAFVALPDLLQLMAGIKASGAIVIRSKDKGGIIHLHDGKIVEARTSASIESVSTDEDTFVETTTDGTQEAVWRMTEWTQGELVFEPTCWEPDRQSPRLPIGQVLMNALTQVM